DLRSFALSGGSIVSVRAGVWARDANDFIFIGKVEDDKLYALNMWRFDDDKNLEKVIFAEEVDYQQDNNWLMRDVQITNMQDENVISKQEMDQMEWHTSLAPDKLAVVTV
ncbi:LptF/LptG family permease, partial [Escherichia coli]|nr:LptF/LptG family permease [Escherichia coli]